MGEKEKVFFSSRSAKFRKVDRSTIKRDFENLKGFSGDCSDTLNFTISQKMMFWLRIFIFHFLKEKFKSFENSIQSTNHWEHLFYEGNNLWSSIILRNGIFWCYSFISNLILHFFAEGSKKWYLLIPILSYCEHRQSGYANELEETETKVRNFFLYIFINNRLRFIRNTIYWYIIITEEILYVTIRN